MRGSHPGTLLSSGKGEVQFEDIAIEIVHTNTIVQHTNQSAPTELLTVNFLLVCTTLVCVLRTHE